MFGRNLDKYRTKFLNPYLVFVMDLVLSVFSTMLVAMLAYLIGSELLQARSFFVALMLGSAFGSFITFFLLGTYKIIIRHFTFKDVAKYILAIFLKVVIMGVAIFASGLYASGVVACLLSDFMISLFILLAVRLVMIYAYDRYKSGMREVQQCTRVLIFGLSDKSAAALARLRNSKHFNVLGFITADSSVNKTMFSDKNVLSFSGKDDVESIVSNLSLGAVLFATEADAKQEQFGLVKYCSELGVKVLAVPTIDEVTDSQSGDQFHVREVKIEDLLGREEIEISLDEIRKNFDGKVVMVTGAAGSIGSELCRQLAGFGVKKLVLYDNAETPMHNLRLELEDRFPSLQFVPIIGDVRLQRRLDFAFRTHHPQVVFHAAAYKHVPLMEENPCEAVLVNVIGSRNVADKCIQYDVEKMVMISTDKAVNPTNIMGCTKRLAEIYVQSLGLAIESGKVQGRTKFVTTRFGNVLGSNGSVIPRFREQIAKGGPVTVTDKRITRFFMTIPEACRLVMEAATMPTENRICVFDMGKPVKIDDLAHRMIELSGFVPDQDIKVVYTGLRPGEKLYEEVLSNVENTEPTSHDRIRIARVRLYDYDDAVEAAGQLETLSREVNIPDMVRLMKKIVPEYISNNSRFQEYDARQ